MFTFDAVVIFLHEGDGNMAKNYLTKQSTSMLDRWNGMNFLCCHKAIIQLAPRTSQTL